MVNGKQSASMQIAEHRGKPQDVHSTSYSEKRQSLRDCGFVLERNRERERESRWDVRDICSVTKQCVIISHGTASSPKLACILVWYKPPDLCLKYVTDMQGTIKAFQVFSLRSQDSVLAALQVYSIPFRWSWNNLYNVSALSCSKMWPCD